MGANVDLTAEKHSRRWPLSHMKRSDYDKATMQTRNIRH